MAEEHINTAFSAFGALDVIFRRCMEGFAFWQRIQGFSESAKDFQAVLDMQRTKLKIWAEEWGIESNNHRKDRLFCMFEPVVTRYLQIIHRILNDLGSLDALMPVLNQTRTFISTGVLPQANDLDSSPSPYDGWNPDLLESSKRSVKWAFQEDELKRGLGLLKTLLEELYAILPPPRHDSARALILSNSLTTQDPDELARISRVGNSDPEHAALAWIKSVAHRPYGTHLGSKQLHMSSLAPINRKEGDAKYMARYQGELVLVEEKQCTVPWGQLEQLNILRARIDSIVIRLQSPSKPEGLRTPPCWGGAFGKNKSNAEDGTTWIYSIVYRANSSNFKSLYECLGHWVSSSNGMKLKQDRPPFPLGLRFDLARMLTRTLMYLHLADWLHKAVRSDNVIFFVDDKHKVQSNLPYLIGFEHSRPDMPGEQTENVTEQRHHKFYRHPKSMVVPVADFRQPLGGPGRYSKLHDIYSMGVLLLEIGLFLRAEAIVETRLRSQDPSLEEIRETLKDKAIPDLRFAAGDSYADAALACLDGSLEKFSGQLLHEAFYKNVVCPLDLCKA